jgi:hypothetical protein
MVTAADGAEKFYQGENNEARYESKNQALEVDRNIQSAWVGHPHFHIISNAKEGFDEKIQDFTNKVLQILRLPQAAYFQKKFLLSASTSQGYVIN